jgi:hypothetical protein
MNAVIAFPSQRARQSAAPASGSGEIVIFPGVRRERRDFAAASPAPRARRRAARVQELEAEEG